MGLKGLFFLAGFMLLFFTLPGKGVVAREFKVGYINSEQIIARYEAAIEAKRKLNAEIVKYEAKAESLKMEYERAKEEYESQQLTLSEEGKRAKLAEVELRRRRYDSYLNEVYGKGGKIDQKNQELIAPIVVKIDSAVSKIAQSEGFALVIDATKAGIVYGEPGLDLTQLVLEELNREYAPIPSSMTGKLLFVIMPIYEANDEAQRERVGNEIRRFVNALIRGKSQVEVVSDKRVDEIVQARGYLNQQIGEEQAQDVARALAADYCIFGECSKRERKIHFKLGLLDVRNGVLLKSQEGEAERKEVLRERVSSTVQALYSALNR